MEDKPKMKERREHQIVVNIEGSFHAKFNELADKEGISSSNLGRRIIIKHLMVCGILPTEAVLDTVL